MVRHARCWILATMLALPLAPAAAQGKPGTATAAGIVYNAPERGTFDRGLDISLRGMGEWPRVSAIAPDHVGTLRRKHTAHGVPHQPSMRHSWVPRCIPFIQLSHPSPSINVRGRIRNASATRLSRYASTP